MHLFDSKTKVYTSFGQCVSETTLAKILARIANPTRETRALIDSIRSEFDTDKRKALKQKLVAFTPCVLCSVKRNKACIVSYTNFAHIDLDSKDNVGITGSEMKERLKQLSYVAFASLSASGNGIFALARIDAQRWNDSIETIITDLNELNLRCDTQVLRNPVSLRFATYDTDAYLNDNATVLSNYKINHCQFDENQFDASQIKTHSFQKSKNALKVERALLEIECENIDITDNYEKWLRIGFAFADEFGESGRGYFHAVSRNYQNYSACETDKQYDHCLKHRFNRNKITIAYFFHLCKQYGVGIDSDSVRVQTVKRDYSKYEKYLTKSFEKENSYQAVARLLDRIETSQTTPEAIFYPFEHEIYAPIRPKYPQRFDEKKLIERQRKANRKQGLFATDLRYIDFETLLIAFGLKDALAHVEHQTRIFQPERYVLYPSYIAFIDKLTPTNA